MSLLKIIKKIFNPLFYFSLENEPTIEVDEITLKVISSRGKKEIEVKLNEIQEIKYSQFNTGRYGYKWFWDVATSEKIFSFPHNTLNISAFTDYFAVSPPFEEDARKVGNYTISVWKK